MTAVAEYPTTAPAGAPLQVRKNGLWRCNFCKGHLHQSCPGAVKDAHPKQQLWICYCCGINNVRCLSCGATEDIDTERWVCTDSYVCQGRVELRRQNSPLVTLLQQCKVAAVNARRLRRVETARIWARVPSNEERMLEEARKASTPRRGTTGTCECCGEATKGGKFLPGHDARLKSRLRNEAKNGSKEAAAELKERGWE